jgi:hypothetical protein
MSILAANNVFPHDPEDNWRLKTDKGGYEGTSQDLKNQIDELMSPDDILVRGAITKDGNKRIIAPYAFRIRIDQVEYTNPDLFETTIRTAAEGHYRIDIFVFTKFSTIVKIEGDEGIESAQEPDTPNGTIKIGFNSVFGSIINEPEIPVPDNTTVKKIESQDFITNYGLTAVIEKIELLDERSSILLIGSVTDIKSIQCSIELIRPGKPFFIKNGTTHNIKIWHNSGTGNIKFFFPDTYDVLLKPNEILPFKLNLNDLTNIKLELVGFNIMSYFLTGVSFVSGAAITAGDNILSAFGKLQKQITDLVTAVSGKQILDNQVEISANSNVLNAWHGQTIIFTSSCTITVPASLQNSLMFPFRSLTGVTVTWAITAPHVWETTPVSMSEKTVGHFMKRGSTNTIILDF